jgi:bacteriorhodopsin
MAITSSIGLCSLAGVGFVTIVGVVPFLIIGNSVILITLLVQNLCKYLLFIFDCVFYFEFNSKIRNTRIISLYAF